jgi:hypothetical protein
LAFKITTDPFVGKLAYFRVYSGKLEAGSYVLNSSTGEKERVGRIVRMQADKREDVTEVIAGDIAAIVGLKGTTTGNTLCDPSHPIQLENITFPEPPVSIAIEPKTKADQEKMSLALQRLAEEDPTFRVRVDDETVLTAATRLADEFTLRFNGIFADGFAVSDLGLTDVRFDAKLALHAIDDDFEVQLTHAGYDGLAGFVVDTDTEGRVFFGETLEGEAHFFLVGFGLWLDSDTDRWLWERNVLELDRV